VVRDGDTGGLDPLWNVVGYDLTCAIFRRSAENADVPCLAGSDKTGHAGTAGREPDARLEPQDVHPVQEATRVASVAELRAAVEAALQQVTEGQQAIQAAREKIGEAQQSLAAALDGSANDAVGAAHASLSQADQQLEDSMSATLAAVEQAHTYTANL
jgi:ribosome-binding protein aMBF1 (putative translation factor)